MNNRKQKIFSTLDSLTQKEIEDYIKDRKINFKTKEFLEKFKNYKGEENFNHFRKLFDSANGTLENIVNKYYKLGEAVILAFILSNIYKIDNIKDIKRHIQSIINDDKELKEYTYECMKDF